MTADTIALYKNNSPRKINPSSWEYLTVGWLNKTIYHARKEPLKDHDLLLLNDKDTAAEIRKYFSSFWRDMDYFNNNESDSLPSPAKAIFKCARIPILGNALCLALATVFQYLIPEFLEQTVAVLSGIELTSYWITTNIYVLAVILFLLQAFSALFKSLGQTVNRRLSQVLQSALTGAIYEKAFRLSPKSRVEYDSGKILTLIEQDTSAVISLFLSINEMWNAPLQLIIVLVLLYLNIGISMLAGFALLLISITASFALGPSIAKRFEDWFSISDKRTKNMREILGNMLAIKFLGSQTYFENKLKGLRNEQIQTIKRIFYCLIVVQGLAQAMPMLMPVVAFSIYAIVNTKFEPTMIFSSLLLFGMAQGPLQQLSGIFDDIFQGLEAWKRITDYLTAAEICSTITVAHKSGPSSIAIQFKDCCFEQESYEQNEYDDKSDQSGPNENETQEVFKLDCLNLEIEQGRIVGIVGPVGSGKSTLLNGIIGQVKKSNGEAYVYGRIAYCPQTPWIIAGTVEENITFESEYDAKKLQRVIAACCLEDDLVALPNGIKTEIGENGVTLSGGQKARVSLARALYKNADIYLLDAPLSALDAKIGSIVFAKAIKSYLQGKTILIATHQIQLLQHTDLILCFSEGKIVQQGTYDEMQKEQGPFAKLVSGYEKEHYEDQNESSDEADLSLEASEKFIEEEELNHGKMEGRLYKQYIQAVGIPFIILAISILALKLGLEIYTPFWLKLWTVDVAETSVQSPYRLIVYISLGAALVICDIALFLTIFYATIRAAISLERLALKGLINSPMSFFDTQPIGRLLNRMTSDVEALDFEMANIGLNALTAMISLISSLVLIAQSTYYILAVLVLDLLFLYLIFRLYLPCNISLKRLTSVKKSPLIAHISESLFGVSSIMSYGLFDRFVKKQNEIMDQYLGVHYMHLSLKIWLDLRLSILSSLITLALVILGASTKTQSIDLGALIGLALTFSIQMTQNLSSLLFWMGETESEFNAVERLIYYIELPPEAPLVLDNDKSLINWPKTGKIEFHDIELRYPSRPEHAVIKNLSFDIYSGEKIGIVGRTGSGKSTLVSALFRIIELSKGKIIIDGKGIFNLQQDIRNLGLETLRKSIQMIPQEPVLFSGTIRTNLDIETKFSDDDLWEALELVGLKEYVSKLGKKLDSDIADNGDNLSAGQKQLICLARAILEKPKVMVMDEATASIDSESNQLLQKSIKTYFKDTTIISIAHRLTSVAGFDRILVLNDGEFQEYDSPHALLQDPSSLFSQLVDASGKSDAALIRETASKQSMMSMIEKI